MILWEDETKRGYLSQKTCLEWVPKGHEDLAGTRRHSFHKRVLSLRAKPLPCAEVLLLCFDKAPEAQSSLCGNLQEIMRAEEHKRRKRWKEQNKLTKKC